MHLSPDIRDSLVVHVVMKNLKLSHCLVSAHAFPHWDETNWNQRLNDSNVIKGLYDVGKFQGCCWEIAK